MLTKEQKIVLSVIAGIICTVLSVCLYGFAVGGEYLSFKYTLYCLVTAFLITVLAFLFVCGKEKVKKLLFKKLFIIVTVIVAVLQLLIYQPLNLLTAKDCVKEYEVEITYNMPRSSDVYFFDQEGTERVAHFNRIISYDDELWPEAGGRMIVRETAGGFDCKHFEIIKVTYEPDIFY